MVGRGELTDAAWTKIAPLMPPHGRRAVGQPPAGRLRHPVTAAHGRPLPERSGATYLRRTVVERRIDRLK